MAHLILFELTWGKLAMILAFSQVYNLALKKYLKANSLGGTAKNQVKKKKLLRNSPTTIDLEKPTISKFSALGLITAGLLKF